MKNAIIIHGMPSKEEYLKPENKTPSNEQWLPWLKGKLIEKGIMTKTPEMPVPYNPVYEDWKETFETLEVNENTILIGHSCGGGFIVRWLSENNIKVGQVILVAPWIDPDKFLTTGMFDFEIDPELVSKTDVVVAMYSTDDDKDILNTITILKEKVKDIKLKEFTDKGHFCLDDLGTEELPELLDLIKI
jgi:predicted alpha/beta hydrolase family esterase